MNFCGEKKLKHNRGLLETLRKLKSTGGSGHIVIFNTLAIGHTKHPHEQRISSWQFTGKNWGHPIVKTLSSYAHPAFHTGPFSSEWITFGSAKFCCCFRSSRKQTSAGRGTRVPSSPYWRNTLDLGERVNYLDHLEYLVSSDYFEHLVHLLSVLRSHINLSLHLLHS